MNPFTVGVAQGIVGLPLFSGMGFRLGLWAVMTAVTVVFMTRYARRVAAKPGTSPMYELDRKREPLADADETRALSRRHPLVLAPVLAALVVLVVGAMRWQWGILELSGLFFGLAIAAGPLGGLSSTTRPGPSSAARRTSPTPRSSSGWPGGRSSSCATRNVIDTVTHAMVATLQGLPSTC